MIPAPPRSMTRNTPLLLQVLLLLNRIPLLLPSPKKRSIPLLLLLLPLKRRITVPVPPFQGNTLPPQQRNILSLPPVLLLLLPTHWNTVPLSPVLLLLTPYCVTGVAAQKLG